MAMKTLVKNCPFCKKVVEQRAYASWGRQPSEEDKWLFGTPLKLCPHCGKLFDADYVIGMEPLPKCDKCGTMLHPGVVLAGEMIDSAVMTAAAEAISCADTLLVVGCNLASRLGSMTRYFNGDKVALVNSEPHYTDRKADCVCIGDSIEQILQEAYPGDNIKQRGK